MISQLKQLNYLSQFYDKLHQYFIQGFHYNCVVLEERKYKVKMVQKLQNETRFNICHMCQRDNSKSWLYMGIGTGTYHSHQTLKKAVRGTHLNVYEGYLRGILGWL